MSKFASSVSARSLILPLSSGSKKKRVDASERDFRRGTELLCEKLRVRNRN